MATKKEILLSINLDSRDALVNVERAKKRIAELRAEQKKLNKEDSDYLEQMADLSAEIMRQQQIVRDNTKAHRDATKAEREEEGSLEQLRGQLAQLTTAYDKLSQAQREGAEGKDILQAIQDTTQALNDAEQASGRFQRNVGNYQSVWDAPISKIESFGDKIKQVFDFDAQIAKLASLGGAFEKVAQALNGTRSQVAGFGRATQQATDQATQARGAMNATAEATAHVGDTTAGATRQTIGFRTAQQQTTQAAQQATTAEQAQATATTSLADATKSATAGFGSMLKAALKFIFSPIGAIIAAIGAAFLVVVKVVRQLTEAFKKNDDAMTALESVMGVFKAVGAAVGAVFELIVKAITPVIEGVGKLARAITSAIPGMRAMVGAQEDLVRSSDELEETHRKNLVSRAKTDKALAELNNKVADSEHYTLEERRDALEESIRLEQEATKAETAEAKERLRLRILQAKQDHDTSDETKNEIASLEAGVYQLEARGEAAQRRAISRRSSFNKEIRKQEAEAAKKAEEARRERADKESLATQALQDLIIAQMIDGEQKQVAELRNATAKQVAELQKRLDTEKNLTAKARAAIQEQIVLIEARTAEEVMKIHDRYNEQEVARQARVALEIWQARLAAARKGSEEERALRLGQLQEQAKQEQAALVERLKNNEITESQYEELSALAMQKRQNEQAAIQAEAQAQEEASVRQHWQNLINSEVEGSRAQMDAKINAKRAEIEALRQLEGESDEAYIGRQIALNNELQALTKQRADAEVAIEQAKAEALGGLMGGISTMIEQVAGDNKEAVMAAKVAALAQVAIEQGLAIAKAVSSAAAGDPYTYAIRVATAIASTVAAMASAISSINEAAGFARGGLVKGPGTSTSDSIPARLSNGEFVVNADATRRHLADLVAINGGWGNTAGGARFADGGVVGVQQMRASADLSAMQSAMRSAVAGIQPVVSVKEIASVTQRVKVKENNAKKY